MPFALGVTAPSDFTSGSDDDADHQYLLQVLLDSHDDGGDDNRGNDDPATAATAPANSHTDIPMLVDALDMELELEALLHDEDSSDDATMTALYCDDHSPVAASMHHDPLLPETAQIPTTDASHSGCSITSFDDCTSTSVGAHEPPPRKLAATPPSVLARAPVAASGSNTSDPGALITRAVAAAITRRRRPRTTAAATKKHKAKSLGSSLVTTASPLAPTVAGAAPAMTAKKLLKYNSNKARDERREELLYLRRMALELEAKLAELKIAQPPTADASHERPRSADPTPLSHDARDNSESPRANDAPTAPAPTTAMVAPMSVWQEIASRQHEHRMKAERENIRLKLVLEGQVKVAKSLEKLVKKTAALKDFDKCVPPERVHYMRPPARDASDAELFAKLLVDVATSYAEVDAVFDAVGLSHMEPSRIDARVQQQRPVDRSGSHHIELQVFGSKVLPFDMHATGSAVWHHYVFAKESTPNRLYCHTPAPPSVPGATEEDTIMESFNMEVDVNSTVVLFCMKVVLRRYVEPDRIVIVWRAFFDPTHVAHEPLHGVRFLEKGYVVVKKMAEAPPASDGRLPPHNLLQTCFISTPVSIGDLVHAEPSKVGALTDLVLSSTAANIASSHQMIENVLLAQALRARQQQQQQEHHETPRRAATLAQGPLHN